MKKLFLFLCMLSLLFSCSQSNEKRDKKEILTIMKIQEKVWSNHNLEGFMEGYWKNDSLKFYGSNGLPYDWKNTLGNYKKQYPTKDHSGSLTPRFNC